MTKAKAPHLQRGRDLRRDALQAHIPAAIVEFVCTLAADTPQDPRFRGGEFFVVTERSAEGQPKAARPLDPSELKELLPELRDVFGVPRSFPRIAELRDRLQRLTTYWLDHYDEDDLIGGAWRAISSAAVAKAAHIAASAAQDGPRPDVAQLGRDFLVGFFVNLADGPAQEPWHDPSTEKRAYDELRVHALAMAKFLDPQRRNIRLLVADLTATAESRGLRADVPTGADANLIGAARTILHALGPAQGHALGVLASALEAVDPAARLSTKQPRADRRGETKYRRKTADLIQFLDPNADGVWSAIARIANMNCPSFPVKADTLLKIANRSATPSARDPKRPSKPVRTKTG